MSRDEPTYTMACIFMPYETGLAVQLIDPASGEQLWIPYSQVHEMHGRKIGERTEGTIVMTEWIAKQKGLL